MTPSKGFSEGNLRRTSEVTPDKVPKEIHEKLPKRVLGKASEEIHSGISKGNPEEMF